MLPWGLDQTFKSDTIHDTGPQPSMLRACLQNTDCAKDYRDVFLQTAKALGAQETALLSLANLAAKQAGKASSYGLSTSHENIYGIITALNYTAFPLTRPPTTTGSGLCATNGVKTGSVTKQVCTNTPDVCEVYIKKGNENGVANIKTCRQYCNAYGIDCMAQHKDKNGCGRGSKYVHLLLPPHPHPHPHRKGTDHGHVFLQMGVCACVMVVLVELSSRNTHTHTIGPAGWA